MLANTLPAEPAKPVRKPEGGYRLFSVMQLTMAWFAYRTERIQFRDLRAYFALHEMEARRCEVDSERLPAFGLSELRGLVGGEGGSRLKRSIDRLEASGLVSWSETKLIFAASPDVMAGDISGLWTMLGEIKNNRRRVPVPRRTVRLIAQAGRPVVVATILAYLLRCVYMRGGGVVGEGTCKASWVADVFRVGERNVKGVKKFLASIGWLTLEKTPHWHRQRYGGRAVVNLAWERPDSYADREHESAPRTADFPPESAPPYVNQKPFQERNLNQKPASAADRPTGFSIGNGEEKKPPTLKHVVVEDLKNTGRLLALHEQAVEAKLVGSGDHERLLFVSLAEHALVKGTLNPCGLFMDNLRKKRFYITNCDEDAAHERLKRHFFGAPRKRECEKKPKFVRVELSPDAKLAAAVQRVVNERRITGDAFTLLRRERPDWTRERWDAAVNEFETARLKGFRVPVEANEDEIFDDDE